MKDVFDLSAQVPIHMSGMRFDQIASELFPDFSRSRLSSWIKDGQLKVDGRTAKPKDKLIGGEVLELKAELEAQGDWQPEEITLDIIHEDDDLIAGLADLSETGKLLFDILACRQAFVAGLVVQRFEGTIAKVAALAALMPIVASMGGIAGTQTLTIMVRGYATGQRVSKRPPGGGFVGNDEFGRWYHQ